MAHRFRAPIRKLLAAAAIAAVVPLAACQQESDQAALALPELPATLPLALDEPPRPAVYAPEAAALPAVAPISAGYIPEPDDYYAYAEDAWGYSDALDGAPPDYGFQYDDVEPWAWQGYDDSLMFVEPLDYGYRYYYYRPGYDYPYFIRDPDCGYGYRDGMLVVIYGSDGRIIPYSAYSAYPVYIDYASRYYHRGHNLYRASRQRYPVSVASWVDRRPALIASYRNWSQERARQRDWLSYHRRVGDRQERYWETERARRSADLVRFAAWREQGFRTPPPPRAIPAGWQRASWARDERRFAPPERGFAGDREDRQRAAQRERQRFAALSRTVAEERRNRIGDRSARLERADAPRPQAERQANRDTIRIARREAIATGRQAPEREGPAAQRQQAQAERRQARAEQQERMVREARQIERVERRRAPAGERRQQAARADPPERATARVQPAREAQAEQRRQIEAREREQPRQRVEVPASEQRRAPQTEARERRQEAPRAETRRAERAAPEPRVREQPQAEQRRTERTEERAAQRQERTQETRSQRVARSNSNEERRARREQ